MIDRFYTILPLMRGEIVLDGTEAHHLAVVCRHREGDRVCLFNGDGRDYHAEVVAASKKNVILNIVEVLEVDRELPFRLEIAAPVPKGDRGDFLIEKLTELGVTRFVPLRTQRSVVEPRDTKLDRYRQKVVEASKQCGRNVLMEIAPLIDWSKFCAGGLPERRLLAHPGGDRSLSDLTKREDVVIALGPEGGFTDDEVEQGMTHGWERVSLGSRILRIETAGIALASFLGMR